MMARCVERVLGWVPALVFAQIALLLALPYALDMAPASRFFWLLFVQLAPLYVTATDALIALPWVSHDALLFACFACAVVAVRMAIADGGFLRTRFLITHSAALLALPAAGFAGWHSQANVSASLSVTNWNWSELASIGNPSGVALLLVCMAACLPVHWQLLASLRKR